MAMKRPRLPAPAGQTNLGTILSPGIPAVVLGCTVPGTERYSSFVWHIESQMRSDDPPAGSHCSVGSTVPLPQTDGARLRCIAMVSETASWFTTCFTQPSATSTWLESF